ncbi:MAG: hypothetical protein GXO72_01270 [Caldiserica bacterium]|nr:hypothetical protein [Caldisericota bacterium]
MWITRISPGTWGWGGQGRGTRGVLYHDLNANGRYDGSDYALGAYPGTFAEVEKRVYSIAALEAAVERGLIEPWPDDIATPDEARAYWAIRDMSRYYDKAMGNLPGLVAIVIGSVRDHVQATPDYLHILLQYSGWRDAGMRWIRLNPDAAYVGLLFPRPAPAADNPAGVPVSCEDIVGMLEPEGIPDPIVTAAAALELSDRIYFGIWTPDLEVPLAAPP